MKDFGSFEASSIVLPYDKTGKAVFLFGKPRDVMEAQLLSLYSANRRKITQERVRMKEERRI